MLWIMAGRYERLEREHTFGADCIVRDKTAMAVQGRFIPRHEIPKITQRTFGEQWIDALTNPDHQWKGG